VIRPPSSGTEEYVAKERLLSLRWRTRGAAKYGRVICRRGATVPGDHPQAIGMSDRGKPQLFAQARLDGHAANTTKCAPSGKIKG
jgi:hypothetical protein